MYHFFHEWHQCGTKRTAQFLDCKVTFSFCLQHHKQLKLQLPIPDPYEEEDLLAMAFVPI